MGQVPPRRRPAAVPRGAARRDRRGRPAHLHRGQQRRVPVRFRRVAGGLRQGLRPVVHRAGLALRAAGRTSATWSATPSPRPTCGCSPRWPASTPSTTATSSATGSKLSEMPVLWAYARDLFQTPGFGDTIDFVQIKQHYYIVHKDINPTQIVPKGPDLSNWLTPHGREALGGRPFGDGTPPGPTREGERVPDGTRGGLGPDGADRPLRVRHRKLVARLVADQGRQLHRDTKQPAAVRIHGGDGDRKLRVRPELVDRRRRPRRTAPRSTAHGLSREAPTTAPGWRGSTVSSPSVCGVSQSVGLSTSQYRYGPTRTSCAVRIGADLRMFRAAGREARRQISTAGHRRRHHHDDRQRGEDALHSGDTAADPACRPPARQAPDGCRRSRVSATRRNSSPPSAPARGSARAVIAVKPTHRSVYTSTPIAPPATQANCSNDSERPNADARDFSGRSSCSDASSEALAIAAAARGDQRGDRGHHQLAGQRGGQRDGGDRDRAPHDQQRRMAELEPGAVKLPAKLPIAGRRADHARGCAAAPSRWRRATWRRTRGRGTGTRPSP